MNQDALCDLFDDLADTTSTDAEDLCHILLRGSAGDRILDFQIPDALFGRFMASVVDRVDDANLLLKSFHFPLKFFDAVGMLTAFFGHVTILL
ncbi:hypothetical protein Xmer_07030 [Xanthomonas campestris pv. merremiae]|nr:hypothetical protein [Xanthomonas campestris pv. merremiae]